MTSPQIGQLQSIPLAVNNHMAAVDRAEYANLILLVAFKNK